MVKHRATIYVVMRHDFTGNDAACAACATPDMADDLVGSFTQQFLDRGFSSEEFYFYVSATTYYKHG